MVYDRLLVEGEKFGLCRGLVRMRSIMRAPAWREVAARYSGAQVCGITSNLRDGIAVGLSKELLGDFGIHEAFAEAHKASISNEHVYYFDTGLCGPMMATATHFYMIGMPKAPLEAGDILVYDWRFEGGTT